MGKGAGGAFGGSGQNSGNTSTSANTTTTSTVNQDNRIATAAGGITATGGSSVLIESLDAKLAASALADMTATAGKSLDGITKATGDAFNFADNANRRSLDTASKATGDAFSFAAHAQDRAFDAVAESARSSADGAATTVDHAAAALASAAAGSSAQLNDTLRKIALSALVGGVFLGAAYLFTRPKSA